MHTVSNPIAKMKLPTIDLPELLVFTGGTYLIKKYVELLPITLFLVTQSIVFCL